MASRAKPLPTHFRIKKGALPAQAGSYGKSKIQKAIGSRSFKGVGPKSKGGRGVAGPFKPKTLEKRIKKVKRSLRKATARNREAINPGLAKRIRQEGTSAFLRKIS